MVCSIEKVTTMKTIILAAAISMATPTLAQAAKMPSDLRGLYCGGEDRTEFLYSENGCDTISIEFNSSGFIFHDDDVPVTCKLINSKVIGREQIISGSRRDSQNFANVYQLKVKCDQGEPEQTMVIHFDRGGI